MLEAVLVLGPPTSPTIKLVFAQTGMKVFGISRSHSTSSHLVQSWSRDYPVGVADGSSLRFSSVDGKGGVGNSTTHFSSQKFASSLNSYVQFIADSGSQKNKKV